MQVLTPTRKRNIVVLVFAERRALRGNCHRPFIPIPLLGYRAELDALSNNLGPIEFSPIGFSPGACLKAPFDKNHLSLQEIVCGILGGVPLEGRSRVTEIAPASRLRH
jgi:hypothetical protein